MKPQAIPAAKLPAVAHLPPPAEVEVKPPAASDPKLQAMLDVPIAKISLPNMPLADAVQLISAMTALPVSFDPDALQELGVSLHDPVSIEVNQHDGRQDAGRDRRKAEHDVGRRQRADPA